MAEYGLADSCTANSGLAEYGLARYSPPYLPPKYPQDTQEAKCLADQVEMYYCDATPEKLALLESFAENPSEFRHMDLVAQLESISLVQAAQENVEETNKQK